MLETRWFNACYSFQTTMQQLQGTTTITDYSQSEYNPEEEATQNDSSDSYVSGTSSYSSDSEESDEVKVITGK